MRPTGEVEPERAAIAIAAREIPDEPVLLARKATGNERGLDRGGSRQDGYRYACRQGGRDDPRAGIVDAGKPCVGDESHPLTRDEPRYEFGNATRLVVLVVREQTSPDRVPFEQNTRVACVLAEHRLSGAKLFEDAQRHIPQVPDRGRADGEGHPLPHSVECLEPHERRSDQPRRITQFCLDDPKSLICRLDRFAARRAKGRPEDQVSRGGAEAPTDDDDIGVEDVRERPDRDPEQTPDLTQCLSRALVPRPCPPDEQGGVCALSVQLDRDSIRRKSRGNDLEVATPVTVALAGRPSLDHDGVPELGPTAVEPIVDHDAATDPRTEREHDQVARAPPGAESPLGKSCRIAVVLDSGRQPVTLARAGRKVNVVNRQVDCTEGDTAPPVDIERDAVPDRSRSFLEQVVDEAVDGAEDLLGRSVWRRDLDRASDRPVARDQTRENLRSAEVDSDNTLFMHRAATITARMPEQEKPYRVYKGGRAKGKVPLQRPPRARDSKEEPSGAPRKPRQRRLGRRITLALAVLLILGLVWLGASYLSFSRGISGANDRVPASVLAELTRENGLLTSKPTTILVLGTDGGSQSGRGDANRSDSVMLIRTDPRKHRLAFLSIPRDLRVEIPGYGAAKINTAFQVGGPTLALSTVKNLTGLEVNHVAFVDFDRFKELIDSVGGIEVDVPRPILSNRFDCPYATAARCQAWEGWRFETGTQKMNGARALVYSRIRENRLDRSETDLDRARRQQQVIQATADKVTSFGTAVKLPFRGGSIVNPLATDLSAGQVLQLGWVYFRANTKGALHCRLGGEPGSADGQSVIFGSEDNVATVSMFTGRSAPLQPPKGLPYAPGCVVGDRKL